MSRLAAAALLTIPLVASSEPPRAEGRIEASDVGAEAGTTVNDPTSSSSGPASSTRRYPSGSWIVSPTR